MLVDVPGLAEVAQLDDVGMALEARVRMTNQRPPALCEGHLVFGRQRLGGEHEHVVLAEQLIELLPRPVVDLPHVDAFDHRPQRRGQTADLHRGSLPGSPQPGV